MVVNFTSNTPKIQTKRAPSFERKTLVQPKMQRDVISFGAEDEKPAPPPEKLHIASNLIKGMFKPIKDIVKSLIEAPLATGVVIAATAAAIATIPIIGTALAIGICGLGAGKILVGAVSAIKDHHKGDNAKANKDIQQVGEGIFDVGLTVNSAIKGVKQIANTVNAIKEASQTVAKSGGNLGIFEKLYAIVQQVQKSDVIPQGPKNIKEFGTRIKEDALKQVAALRETITGSKPKVSVPEIEQVLDKVGQLSQEQAGKVAGMFDQIAATIRDEGGAKAQLQQAAGWIRNSKASESLAQISANRAQIIDALSKANLDSVLNDPQIIKVVNKVMTATNPDETVGLIKKLIKTPEADEVAKVTAATGEISGDDSQR